MKRYSVTICTILLLGLVAACQPATSTPPPPTPAPPTATPEPSPTPLPTSTPTPQPPKEFTICQAEEPNTLFLYGGPSRAARNVLAAIYDGPIDRLTYQFQPVILEKIPNLADGDVSLRTVEVGEGERVVEIGGLTVDLLPGVTLSNATGQTVTFESGVVTMTQMAVTFTLRTDVTWADGQPVTADDSRYSFELAGAFDYPALRQPLKRTASYEVVDEQTVVWRGLPGYRDPLYALNFYAPLPRHVWGGTSAENLLSAEVAHRKPLGWGPFVVEAWTAGERITLVRNPHYFRAAEGLPHLDRLIFRFVPDVPQALDMLAAGECDLIGQDLIEAGDLTGLLEAAAEGQVQLITAPSSEWEHLDFGIQPASWVTRPDFFGDERVRQAVAQCVDRERIAEAAFPYDGAVAAHSYIPPDHPLYASEQLSTWTYDPTAGQALLEEVGWRDEDGDGLREAFGVPGVASGTPFTITLLTTQETPARERTARLLAEDLGACGIGVGVRPISPQAFFADGPDGLVFGRQFDLALFSWLNGFDAPCDLYLSDQMPSSENWWAASNNPGYASADYDAACRAAQAALPGEEAYTYYHLQAQRIFSYDLPVLPLYFVPKLVAARPGVTGVVLDPSQYLELWGVEAFDLPR